VQGLADAGGLRLTEGRLVLELRPPVRGNKGTALAALVDDYALAGVVFLGDDVTDLDAIAELRRLRDAGRTVGLAVGVVASESPPALREAVDLAAPGVDGAAALLAAVADQLERGLGHHADARPHDS
jgi:trehalose 6-phosphate phosphatase